MFNGIFKLGGNNTSIANKTVGLFRIDKDYEHLHQSFIDKIPNSGLAWDGINEQLIHRDEKGDTYVARFEPYV